MRIRTVLLVLATVALVLFALLNWPEITRPTEINLGWQTVTAPMGLVLLGLLLLAGVVFLAISASSHTRHLVETRQHAKALQAQRDLADRAEASRFTDLRQQIETHLRESRQREATHATELDQSLGRHIRELRNQLQELQRGMAMRLGEMEARLTHRPLHETQPSPEALRAEQVAAERMEPRQYPRGEPVRDVRGEPVAGVDRPLVDPDRPAEPVQPGPYDRVR